MLPSFEVDVFHGRRDLVLYYGNLPIKGSIVPVLDKDNHQITLLHLPNGLLKTIERLRQDSEDGCMDGYDLEITVTKRKDFPASLKYHVQHVRHGFTKNAAGE